MTVRIESSHPDRPPAGRYSDSDAATLLAVRVRGVLDAERALRQARADLDAIVASCRRAGQHAQADAALKDLAERRAR